MSFPTLLARQCHNCSFKLRENDVYMAIERPLKIKINAEDAHKLESRDNFFQITWHYFSDHVLKIEALRSKISSGTFTSPMVLMVGTFVLAKGEVHRATRLYYISTKHSPDRVMEQCFGIHNPLKLNKTCFSLRLNTSREFPDPVGSPVSQLFFQTPGKRCLHGYWATVKNQNQRWRRSQTRITWQFFSDHMTLFFRSRVKNRSASK